MFRAMFNSQFFLQSSLHFKRGQAMITAVVFFLFISMSIVLGITSPILSEIKVGRELADSMGSFYIAQAGIESVTLRAKKGYTFNAIETVPIGIASSSISVTEPDSDNKIFIATGITNNATRAINAGITRSTGTSFLYGSQSGNGGIVLENNSTITGNILSNGAVTGSGSNLIGGNIISTGSNGLADSVHATGTVYAHTIRKVTVDGDAHYQSISNSTVWGTLYPGSVDQASGSFPISDATIAGWESLAATSVISSPCPYTIQSDMILGPTKITCDVKIKGSSTITLRGPVWIVGTMTIENSPMIKIDSSLGNKSVAIIADNTANQTTSSQIFFENNTQFAGSGTAGSYIVLISQNKSAEQGGGKQAIEVENNIFGDVLLYASHGEILLKNNAVLKEATGYRVRLQNNANVVYEKGLENLVFSSGSGGAWRINGWSEQ